MGVQSQSYLFVVRVMSHFSFFCLGYLGGSRFLETPPEDLVSEVGGKTMEVIGTDSVPRLDGEHWLRRCSPSG